MRARTIGLVLLALLAALIPLGSPISTARGDSRALTLLVRSFKASARFKTFHVVVNTRGVIAETYRGKHYRLGIVEHGFGAYKLGSRFWMFQSHPILPRAAIHLHVTTGGSLVESTKGPRVTNHWFRVLSVGNNSSIAFKGRTLCSSQPGALLWVGGSFGEYDAILPPLEAYGFSDADSTVLVPEKGIPVRSLLVQSLLVKTRRFSLHAGGSIAGVQTWRVHMTLTTKGFQSGSIETEAIDYWISQNDSTLRRIRLREWTSHIPAHATQVVATSEVYWERFSGYGSPVHPKLPSKCATGSASTA